MKNYKILTALLLCTTLIVSCSPDNSPTNPTDNKFTFPGLGSSVIQYFPSGFDTTNMVALVRMTKENHDYIDTYFSNPPAADSYTTTQINADFRPDFIPIAPSIAVNASGLRQFSPGAFQTSGAPNVYMNGMQNKIEIIAGGAGVNTVLLRDSVTLTSQVAITNIATGSTHNKTQPLTINWNGASAGSRMKISVTAKPVGIPSSGTFTDSVYRLGNVIYIDNTTGSYTLDALKGNKYLRPGYVDIQLTKYEPIARTMSNGKKICIMGISVARKTIIVE